MKQFLYLDVDIINSIIAQSEKGLVQSLSNEQVSSDTELNNCRKEANINAKFGGSLLKLAKAESNLSGTLETLDEGTSISTSREIISKTMHDAAFDVAYTYIKPIKIISGVQNQYDTGDYIEMKRIFHFVDFDYLERLFGKEGIVDFIKKDAVEKIRSSANKKQSEIKNSIKKSEADTDRGFDYIATIIKALRALVPYNRMLISSDGYLIPLNTKYFRVDPKDLGFKYGGEITCVGMITNIIEKDKNPDGEENIFSTLNSIANESLRAILPINKNSFYVIHPIGIYYETNRKKSKTDY